jgi:hypothetical protein
MAREGIGGGCVNFRGTFFVWELEKIPPLG